MSRSRDRPASADALQGPGLAGGLELEQRLWAKTAKALVWPDHVAVLDDALAILGRATRDRRADAPGLAVCLAGLYDDVEAHGRRRGLHARELDGEAGALPDRERARQLDGDARGCDVVSPP